MRTWLISTLLALGPAPPGPSRVELDVSGLEHHMPDEALHRFHGELLLRLLEAGHGVGSEGDVVLALTSAGDTIVVECWVADRRERIEVDDADAAVLGLELVHRAVDLVERCTPAATGSGDVVAIDTDGSIELGELVWMLADTPMTLIGPVDPASQDEHGAAWRLCVRERSAFVVVIDEACDTVTRPSGAEPREAIARWRASTQADSATSEDSVASPVIQPTSEPAPAPPPTIQASQPWGLSVGAAGGMHLRLPGVGGIVSADLAAVHHSGVFVGGFGSLSPSQADRLAVIDGLGLATVGWRGHVAERLVLRPSLGLGVVVHRYVFADQPVEHRVDLAIRVPLELQVQLAGRTSLSLAVAATVSPRRIEHVIADELLWTRAVVRLDALIGLRFDWIPTD